jgi:hypothetical protein
MKKLLPSFVCIFLVVSTVWATTTINIPVGQSILQSPHGFEASSGWAHGSNNIPITAISETIAGVEVCTDHDDEKWHTTVKRDINNNIVCTYGHEHGDNPHAVNDIFGAPNSWYGGTQEISYPWATPQENTHKHWFYKYLVRRDLKPLPNQGMYLKAIRAVGHLEGFSARLDNGIMAGFSNPLHSYSFEAQICTAGDNQCGTIQMGGWQSLGKGVLAYPHEVCVLWCNLPINQRRIHGSEFAGIRTITWYGANVDPASSGNLPGSPGRIGIELGTGSEATGWVDPNDYETLHQHPPTRVNNKVSNEFNGSAHSLAELGIRIPYWLTAEGLQTHRVTLTSVANRWGYVLGQDTTACRGEDGGVAYNPDCIPVKLVNVYGDYMVYQDWRHDQTHGGQTVIDKDIYVDFEGDRKSLIRFPN